MKWDQVDKYAQRSRNRHYSICAIGFDNGHTGFFEAWRSRTHPDGPCLISTNLKTAAQARDLCEQDNQGDP